MKKGNLLLVMTCLAVLTALVALLGACSSTPAPSTTAPSAPKATTAAPSTAAPTTTAPSTSAAPKTTAPASSAPATSAAAAKPIKIGLMTPSTGIAAEKGSPMGHANLDAIEYINKELGGVAGHPIDPVWLDSQYDPAKVVTNMKFFMDQGAVMWGTASSKEGGAAQDLANKNEFPGIISFTAPSNYRPPLHVYGQMPDYGDDAIAFATYYMKNVWKDATRKPKFAVMILNNPTGYGARDAFEAKAGDLGIEIIKPYYEHAATDVSMMTALTAIKAAKPDVLYISSTPNPTAVIIKEAASLGLYPGITIGSGHAGLTRVLVDIAGADKVEGVYGVFPTVSWGDNVPGMAKMTEYVKKLHPVDVNNMDYITSWAQSLVMAEALRLAIQNAGFDVVAKGDVNSWRAVETKGIQALKDYKVDGLHGPVSYTPGDNRLAKSVRVFQIKKGAITAITDWIEAPVIKYETYPWFGK